jgi:hypothetical protein
LSRPFGRAGRRRASRAGGRRPYVRWLGCCNDDWLNHWGPRALPAPPKRRHTPRGNWGKGTIGKRGDGRAGRGRSQA